VTRRHYYPDGKDTVLEWDGDPAIGIAKVGVAAHHSTLEAYAWQFHAEGGLPPEAIEVEVALIPLT
jgi:hypothetical protein